MKRNYSCAATAGLIFLLSICCFGGFYYWLNSSDINASILEWQTGLRLNDMYRQVSSMPVNGVSLTKQTDPSTGQGGTLSCVYGGAEQVYVSQRDYIDILADYSIAFQKIGWTKKSIPAPDPLENATVFYLPKDMHFIVVIAKNGSNLPSSATSYTITFDFEQCTEFWPRWRIVS